MRLAQDAGAFLRAAEGAELVLVVLVAEVLDVGEGGGGIGAVGEDVAEDFPLGT